MPVAQSNAKTRFHHVSSFFWLAVGAFLAAVSIRIFLLPNQLIDGGVVGVSLILARLYGDSYLSYVLVLLNLPFIFLAYTYIRRTFVIHMLVAVILFAGFLIVLQNAPPFIADPLEIIVFGGAILGVGCGLIIRNGGCLDGTEILAIIINRKKGFTVGQVVLFINVFIFGAYGWIFQDWHIALRSLMTYIVAFKMIDLVIVGLDELKSALIISSKPRELGNAIMNELGLGLTIMHGRGGFSGDTREILFVIIERLDLSELKEIVLREDPAAFMAIEDLHEVVYGKQAFVPYKKRPRGKLFKKKG
ncbi:MAG: YitT family protein, partial [Verrucomicrobia bacterium]|nr:YitT family protein [Verrucomicrobiota bacterium]